MSEREVRRVERPAVLGGIPESGHVVLEASAGTGKTFTLENLVVDLLLRGGVPIERMLVVTFTEKATEELRVRLRRKLQELAADEDGAEPAEGADCWLVDEAARERLRDALVRFDAATIATIHGFCQRVLTEHAFAHRRLFEQRLIDGREAFARVFRDVVRRALGRDHASRRALTAFLRGGGTIEKLERTVYEATRQRAELTPRWDPEALASAAAELMLLWTPALVVRGFKAAGVQLRAELQASVLDPTLAAARLLEHGEVESFVDALTDWALKDHRVDGRPDSRWNHLRAGLAALGAEGAPLLRAMDRLADVTATPLAGLVSTLREDVTRRLGDLKRSQGLYDFDDMLVHVRDSLCGPGGGELAAALRERWSLALIDEFQDTDEVQWDIFRTLFYESPGHRLFLIGDPKQAIYGFRSADVQAYLAAREAVDAGGGRVVPLTANHRSTAPLVAATNRLFAEGWFTGELADFPRAVAGQPRLRLAGADGDELAPVVVWRLRGEGRRPRGDAVVRALGGRIAVEARRLVEGGARFADLAGERPLAYGDLMVLARKRSETVLVAEALRRHGVPHVLFGQEGLLAGPEAAHVHRLLLALAAPADAGARLQAWLTPFFAVPLAALARCRELPESHPLVGRLLAWRDEAEARRYPALFRRVLRESGLVRRLLATREGERELTNYQQVFDLLVEEAQRSPAAPAELAARLGDLIAGRRAPPGAEGDVQRLEPERDAVQVLTMHRAKGLQAPVVFLVGGMADWRPQDALRVYHRGRQRRVHLGPALGEVGAAIEREAHEEAQRLLYVALTRARGRLYLPSMPPRSAGGGGEYAVVERRLAAVIDGPGGPAPGFLVETHDPDAPVVPTARGGPPRLDPVVAAAATAPGEAPRFASVRRAHAGRLLTSYTRIRRASAAVPSAASAGAEDPPGPPLGGEEELPGGRATGILLHRLLELVDPRAVLAAPAQADWESAAETLAVSRRVAGELGFPAAGLPAARRLVWRALRTPLRAGALALPRGLCEPARREVEMELLFPIPEVSHPPLGAAGGAMTADGSVAAPGFRAERGFVQGVVDLVFEHDGRTWFVDWKSDRLARWDAATLDAHVAEHYRLQAQLYALGVLRLLAPRDERDHDARFGGLLYCFVRGMDAAGTGVWHLRPGWDDLRRWEEELRSRRDWGRVEAHG